MQPFVHPSIVFWLYTALQYRSSRSIVLPWPTIQIYMQKHNDDTITTSGQKKIYLSLYPKGLRKVLSVRGELETEQKCNILTPQLFWLSQPFFPVLLRCSTRGLEAKPLLRHGSHSSIFSPTDLNFLLPGLYNCSTPTYFLWASHLHSIQPVDSQGYPLISSTGCTCYLHRCISSLTTRPG